MFQIVNIANGLFLDEWLSLCAGTLFVYLTQWFATILSATEMTKIGHNSDSQIMYDL